jgi:predicted O-methyltransferase YrrM
MHGWSGQVAIVADGQPIVIDLYAEAHRAISVYPNRSPVEIVPLEAANAADLRVSVPPKLTADPTPVAGEPRQALGTAIDPPGSLAFNNPLPSIGADYDRLLRAPERFAKVIYDAPALMAPQERVLLYGLVFALNPRRCLEIGTNRGGSAAITVAALDDIGGDGRIVCIDPVRLITDELWDSIRHRARFIQGPSPQALDDVGADGPFDFVNIDGLHDYDHAIADARGVLPYLADEAYIVFHDAYYFEVRQAIDQFIAENAGALNDIGVVARSPNPEKERPEAIWGGVRVLRYQRPGAAAAISGGPADLGRADLPQ